MDWGAIATSTLLQSRRRNSLSSLFHAIKYIVQVNKWLKSKWMETVLWTVNTVHWTTFRYLILTDYKFLTPTYLNCNRFLAMCSLHGNEPMKNNWVNKTWSANLKSKFVISFNRNSNKGEHFRSCLLHHQQLDQIPLQLNCVDDVISRKRNSSNIQKQITSLISLNTEHTERPCINYYVKLNMRFYVDKHFFVFHFISFHSLVSCQLCYYPIPNNNWYQFKKIIFSIVWFNYYDCWIQTRNGRKI